MMKIEDLKIIPGLFSFKVDTPNERSACRQRFIIWELGLTVSSFSRKQRRDKSHWQYCHVKVTISLHNHCNYQQIKVWKKAVFQQEIGYWTEKDNNFMFDDTILKL